jgi:hypothetical protein
MISSDDILRGLSQIRGLTNNSQLQQLNGALCSVLNNACQEGDQLSVRITFPEDMVIQYPDIMKISANNVTIMDPTISHHFCALPTCHNVATKQCGSCKAVYYCSKDCQHLDWKYKAGHQIVCLEIKKSCSNNILKGEEFVPFIYVDLYCEDIERALEMARVYFYKILLRIKEDSLGVDEQISLLFYALFQLGKLVYNDKGRIPQRAYALSYFLLALKISNCLKENKSNGIADAINHVFTRVKCMALIGDCLNYLERHSEAILILKDCLEECDEICMKLSNKHDVLYSEVEYMRIQCLTELACAFCQKCDNTDAVVVFQHQYLSRSQLFAPDDYNLHVILNMLVDALCQSGDLDLAEEYCRVAVDNLVTHGKEWKLSKEDTSRSSLAEILIKKANKEDGNIIKQNLLLDEAEKVLIESIEYKLSICYDENTEYFDLNESTTINQLSGVIESLNDIHCSHRKSSSILGCNYKYLKMEVNFRRIAMDKIQGCEYRDLDLAASLFRMAGYLFHVLVDSRLGESDRKKHIIEEGRACMVECLERLDRCGYSKQSHPDEYQGYFDLYVSFDYKYRKL